MAMGRWPGKVAKPRVPASTRLGERARLDGRAATRGLSESGRGSMASAAHEIRARLGGRAAARGPRRRGHGSLRLAGARPHAKAGGRGSTGARARPLPFAASRGSGRARLIGHSAGAHGPIQTVCSNEQTAPNKR
ncbi:hypothetical protein T492DRAFT_837074 [Pavlovales sp. CCMP2436]|nr:hypothetical protein T492DRAFT_837074 [Pavlovales sp. CCMP2436]